MKKIPVMFLTLITFLWGIIKISKVHFGLFLFMMCIYVFMLVITHIVSLSVMERLKNTHINKIVPFLCLLYSVLCLVAGILLKIFMHKKIATTDIYIMDIFIIVFFAMACGSYTVYSKLASMHNHQE